MKILKNTLKNDKYNRSRRQKRLQTISMKNDFKTIHPYLSDEWDYDKNGDLRPEQFLPKSGKKVWWKCKECGYEWESTIKSRSNGARCKNCQMKK